MKKIRPMGLCQQLKAWPTFVCLLLSAGCATASDLSGKQQLNTIYDYSGIRGHLASVLGTVAEESTNARQACANQDNLPDITASLDEMLSDKTLSASFLMELEERIDVVHRAEILAWIDSPAGQRIHKAEVDSSQFDDAQFDTMLNTFKASDKNTPARTQLMRDMLSDTGAVYFISAVNTETSTLVAMAGVCSALAQDIATAETMINDERTSEAFSRSFMRQELVLPSNVVYQNITDEHIGAYSAFAKSEAGNAYFVALIKGVRSVLSERVERLKMIIEES